MFPLKLRKAVKCVEMLIFCVQGKRLELSARSTPILLQRISSENLLPVYSSCIAFLVSYHNIFISWHCSKVISSGHFYPLLHCGKYRSDQAPLPSGKFGQKCCRAMRPIAPTLHTWATLTPHRNNTEYQGKVHNERGKTKKSWQAAAHSPLEKLIKKFFSHISHELRLP